MCDVKSLGLELGIWSSDIAAAESALQRGIFGAKVLL